MALGSTANSEAGCCGMNDGGGPVGGCMPCGPPPPPPGNDGGPGIPPGPPGPPGPPNPPPGPKGGKNVIQHHSCSLV